MARHDPWAELRDEYVRVVRQLTGAAEDVALKTAGAMVRAFQQRFGGEQVYVPRPLAYDEAEVLRDFNGRNVAEVLARHRIGRTTLYRILGRARGRGEAVPEMAPPPVAKPSAPLPPPRVKDFNW